MLGQQHGFLPRRGQPQHPLQRPLVSSCREKDGLASSLQAAQQLAEELRQECEKLQTAQGELRRQRDRLEEEREDTAQDRARTRRELERRRVTSGLPAKAAKWPLGLPTVSLGATEDPRLRPSRGIFTASDVGSSKQPHFRKQARGGRVTSLGSEDCCEGGVD